MSKTRRETDWTSMRVAAFMAFCATAQFGLYFSSLWPYLETIDPEASEQFLGVIIAAYCVALSIFCPIFGYWSNRVKQIKLPMTFGICCMVLGNILYLSCELFPHDRRYVLLMARFITGIGSANVALIRTYASTACHPDDRGRAISFITVGLSMGIMLGPAFQMFFTPISYPGWVIFGGLSVSMYTMPAYAACTMNLFALFTLHFCFKESYAGLSEESEIENNIPKYDIVAVVTCNFTRFVQQLIYTNLDIVAGPFALTVFGYPKQMAVQTASTAMTAHGAVAAFLLAVFIIFKLQN